MTVIQLVFTGLGVPTDLRFDATVRERAKLLAAKRPGFYRMEGENILWCDTIDEGLFQSIYDWVLYNKGTEPE